jgi:single-stranded-DNA-specific exonuclease
MLEGFGGHPMAAGLRIDRDRIAEFRRVLSRTVRERCEATLEEEPTLQIDGYVPLADLSLEFVEEMERLAPFGPGNPSLTLATRGVSLKGHTSIGRTGEHLKLILEDEEGGTQQALWWRAEPSALPQGPFDLAYVVRASDYRGQRDVQVEWVAARPIEEATPSLHAEKPLVAVVDHRDESDRQEVLRRLQARQDVLVWSEGKAEVAGRGRHVLEPSRTLVIWTTPPGAPELRAALSHVSPETVHLFGVNPDLDHPKGFLKRLAQLAKRAITTAAGRVELPALASETAQREETVRAGLAWLEGRGYIVMLEERDKEMRLAPGEQAAGSASPETEAHLRSLLKETAAYRAFFARADAETLINNARSA